MASNWPCWLLFLLNVPGWTYHIADIMFGWSLCRWKQNIANITQLRFMEICFRSHNILLQCLNIIHKWREWRNALQMQGMHVYLRVGVVDYRSRGWICKFLELTWTYTAVVGYFHIAITCQLICIYEQYHQFNYDILMAHWLFELFW